MAWHAAADAQTETGAEAEAQMTLRLWLWCVWHTRPFHKPAGIIMPNRYNAYCSACGAKVPM